jgi:hypothetical protein
MCGPTTPIFIITTFFSLSLHNQLDGELLLAPGFAAPPNLDYQGYHTYIDEHLPPETPYLYGLHPNAEIGFLTTTSESLFHTVLEMQPRDSSGAGGGGATREEQVGSWIVYVIVIMYICIVQLHKHYCIYIHDKYSDMYINICLYTGEGSVG